MRYLLVDRITRLEANKSISAIKNVTLSEEIYNDHFFGFPVTPGALQIEAVAQAATALLEVSAAFEKKALLIMVKDAKFRHLVKPGDQLVIEAKISGTDADTASIDGMLKVGPRIVMNTRLILALRDASEFYKPQARPLVDAFYASLLRDADLINVPKKVMELGL